MKKSITILLVFAVVLVFSMKAQAALQNLGTDSLGNRLIYDTDLDITWYDYLNWYAYSEEIYSWQKHMNWAAGLTVTTATNTYDDWRLPITFDQGCTGYNCTNSEMGHLYYTELGNVAYGGLANAGDFQNLLSSPYWSGTENSTEIDLAWAFNFNDGSQYSYAMGNPIYAMAVRPGLAVVPEPISSTLFLIGGATLGFRRFRNKRGKK